MENRKMNNKRQGQAIPPQSASPTGNEPLPQQTVTSASQTARQHTPAQPDLQKALDRIAAHSRVAQERQEAIRTLEIELSAGTMTRKDLEAAQGELRAEEPVEVKKCRGTPSPELVRRAERRLIEQEQLGLFDCQLIEARNEFPTLLARLPVFPPTDRNRQKALLDKDNALRFETPFGHGRRHGPPVTTDDEDRLIALMRLRQRRIIGHASRLPIPLTRAHYAANEKGELAVHWICCTISQIHDEMDICDSGENYLTTLDSLKRLNAIVLEVETKKHDLYFGHSRKGTAFKLVDIIWEAFDDQGLIMAQFSPIVALWLEQQATYLNWDVRRKLKGRNARALHRFLSTQPKHYRKEMLYIAQAINWEGEKRRMKRPLQSILDRLVDLCWLAGYDFAGTGRKTPYIIDLWRV